MLNNNRSVCVHIRLGDYVNNPVHGVCTLDYYIRAMDIMAKKYENPLFYVCTNSPELIKNAPEFKKYNNLIFEPDGLQDFEAMYLMTLCSDYILSNGSFSWWGYYLSKNRVKNQGITIAPDKWYKTDIPCDIYMPDWTLIKP